MDNVSVRRDRITRAAVETKQRVLYVLELNVTVSSIKILSVAQQCFYGEFISLATI